jgi:DnaK suppressor protein
LGSDPPSDGRNAGARALLVHERARTLDQVVALARAFDEFVESAEFVATDDEHDPEGHTIAFERQQVAGLLRAARSRLAELDLAIAQLDAGTYGRCDRCGRPIADERLAALPATRTCIDCARRL